MRHAGCLSDLALDRHLAGAPPDGPAQAHLASCADCGARLEQLRLEREQFLLRARPAAFAEQVLARRRPGRGWLLWCAPLLAGAAALLFVLRAGPPDDGDREKGGKVATELFVRSGDQTTSYDPARHYRAGDVLQLLYSTSAPRRLLALDVEAGGKISVLYHAADPLPAGTRRPLDQSFVLDEAPSAERIYFVFTDGPADETAALAAARRADPRRDDKLDLPGVVAQASFLIQR